MRQLLISLAGIMLITAAFNALAESTSVYRWVDSNGQVHFSDQPPPGHARMAQMKVQTNAPSANADKHLAKLQKQLNTDARKAQTNRRAQDQKARQTAAKAEACAEARRQANLLQSMRRLRVAGKDGKEHYYTGDDLVQKRQQLNAKIEKFCGG